MIRFKILISYNNVLLTVKTEIDAFERIEHNQLRKQNQLWTQHIKYLTDIDKYELEIDQHNKTIKTVSIISPLSIKTASSLLLYMTEIKVICNSDCVENKI